MATLARPLPRDIRLMNGVSMAIFALAIVVLVTAGVLALWRAPRFAVRAIELHGDLTRNSAATIRANTVPRLAGNFYSLDLAAAKKVFESVPWVRQAVVRRVWPDRLAVELHEHQPAARWTAEDGSERLVNQQGEVFEANLGDVESDGLPLLTGPEGSAAAMLDMYRRTQALFQRMERSVAGLSLSGRGSYRVELEDGAIVEMGRGEPGEVLARTERFVATVSQVTGHYHAPLLRADLRHAGGYAVRLRGVTVAEGPAGAKGGTP